jgi:hypothetical protein
MRCLSVLCCVLAGACLPSTEISGHWNIGGPGGCQSGHAIYITISDGGQHTAAYVPCSAGRFEQETPSSSSYAFVHFSEMDHDVVYSSAEIELRNASADMDIGLVTFIPK